MPEPEVVYVRVPRHVKEQILEAASTAGLTLNSWAANVLAAAARGEGLPPPPPALPLPDPSATAAAIATGERLLGPCGASWPCRAILEPLEELAGLNYCRCGLRVS